MGLGGEYRGKMSSTSRHIKGTHYHKDYRCGCSSCSPGRVVCFRFLHWKVSFSSFSPHCNLWKEVTMPSSHLRSRELCSLSLRSELLYNFFFAYIYLFTPFTYLFNHLFILVWTQIFTSFGCNRLLYHSFCRSDHSSFGHWEHSQLVPVSLWHTPITVGFF